MKLVRLGLVIILSLVLLGLICPAARADDNKAEVDLTVEVVPPPPPPPGGAPPIYYYTKTNLFGVEKSFRISRTGEILKTIEATSEDGMLTLTIPRGTIALGKDGKRLKGLEVAVDESPPDPPEDAHIIGLAYDFGPDGATFNPAIAFTWSYDPEALPEAVAEEDLVLAYYDEAIGEWVDLPCVVDIENNIITASVPHFTTFAIIGAVTPLEEEVVPPPEEVVPPPEEVVPSPEVVPPPEEVVPPPEEVVPPPVPEEVPPPVKPPINWPLVGGVIGGVVVVGLLVFFLVVRRRALKAKH